MSGGDWKDLFRAACAGDVELVRYHATLGVDLDYQHPEFLSTPLVACILAGQAETAGVLLDHGADPNLLSDLDGLTPVQAARKSGLTAIEQRLLDLGADPGPEATTPAPRRRWWRRRDRQRSG